MGLMLDALAHLAYNRRRLVAALAAVFFVAAGALGGSVADRLDPYGAEDPETETARATDRLEEAGYRVTGVVVLIEGIDVESAEGSARLDGVARELDSDPDVEEVTG